MDGRQDVEAHFVLVQQAGGAHHFFPGGLAAFIDAVEVVEFAGAVHTQTDQEVAAAQKVAPFVVEQRTIGLERVFDLHARLLVLLLELDRFLEVVQPHQRRLAPLPGEGDLRDLLRFDVLAGVLFEHRLGHAELAVRVHGLLAQEVAVVAVQVADCAARFEHDVEGGRRRDIGCGRWVEQCD